MNKTILVTGASGTVGSCVVSLAEAAGYRVVASDLRQAGVPVPLRGEVRAADLTAPEAADYVVRGVDAVIHTAAQLDARANTGDLARINTDAVVDLYRAATRAGVSRFVHMSTATLYGHSTGSPLDETAALRPRGAYGLSKHAAEVFLREQRQGPDWTIVRAAPLYGRRGRHFAASLLVVGPILRLLSPWLPRLRGGTRAQMVHAEDVARALLFLLEHPEAKGQVFNVADEDALPLGERLRTTFLLYGLHVRGDVTLQPRCLQHLSAFGQRPLPYQGLDAALLAAWKTVIWRHQLKPALRPRLDRESLMLMQEDLPINAARLRALGWRPRFPRFESGWAEVLRWYQAEAWVPRYA
ncbi:MAG: NAD-dependent epimerase/dehydratase family protein [Polyangiales bacterium]